MGTAYTVCMIVGIAVPLLSLVLSGLFDFFDTAMEGVSETLDGLDLDFTVDIGDTSISLLPLSMHGLCAGLLVFGTVGKIVYNGGNLLMANILGVAAGYLAAACAQTLVDRLKKVDNSPLSRRELMYCDAKVTNTILAGGFGAISVRTEEGAALSYPAKADDSTEEIRQDTPVNIVRFEKNVAIVKKARQALRSQELTLFDP